MDRRFLVCAVAALLFVGGVTAAQAVDRQLEADSKTLWWEAKSATWRQAGDLKIEADSQGVKFQIGDVEGTAKQMAFQAEKGFLTLEGSESAPVRLVRTANGQQWEITAVKIFYWLKSGEIRAQSAKSVGPLGPQ